MTENHAETESPWDPIVDQERTREVIRRVRGEMSHNADFGVRHQEKEVSIEFQHGTGEIGESFVRIMRDTDEAEVMNILATRGWRISGTGRIAVGHKEGRGFFDDGEEESTFGRLRESDAVILEEYFEHPERFIRY